MDHPVETQPRSNVYQVRKPISEVGVSPYNNGSEAELVFNPVSIRLGFIRKVFGIFTAQVILTTGLLALTNLNVGARTVLREHVIALAAVPLLIALVLFLILLAKTELTRRFPVNFILLGIFTLSLGFGVAVLATLTEQGHVLYASGILLCSCTTVTLYTFQTKFDLRWYIHGIIVFVSVGLVSLILYAVLPSEEPSVLLISAAAGLAISIYLAILVHGTMSGDWCCQFRPENYVRVSLYAYLVLTSVFLLALFLMVLVGGGEGGGCDGCGNCPGGDCGSGGCCNCYGCCGEEERQTPRDDSQLRPPQV